MFERALVEEPFLDQFAALGWTVIDQGAGVPTDPTESSSSLGMTSIPNSTVRLRRRWARREPKSSRGISSTASRRPAKTSAIQLAPYGVSFFQPSVRTNGTLKRPSRAMSSSPLIK